MPKLEASDIHLEVILEHRLADFSEGIDLAIRCGKGPWAGVRSLPLWQEKLVPIAAPAVAERLGGRTDAKSLLELPILHDSNVEAWRRWLAVESVDYVPRGQDRRFEDYNLVIDACAHGLGIALARPAARGRGACLRPGRRRVRQDHRSPRRLPPDPPERRDESFRRRVCPALPAGGRARRDGDCSLHRARTGKGLAPSYWQLPLRL
jgi:DNA-binding transcriptional LysR family regulator